VHVKDPSDYSAEAINANGQRTDRQMHEEPGLRSGAQTGSWVRRGAATSDSAPNDSNTRRGGRREQRAIEK